VVLQNVIGYLLNDKKYFNNKEARTTKKIETNNRTHFFLNKNDHLKILKVN